MKKGKRSVFESINPTTFINNGNLWRRNFSANDMSNKNIEDEKIVLQNNEKESTSKRF